MMSNIDYERHEMTLVTTHISGAEEWHCAECGHRFMMTWPPDYHKVVLEQGDHYAIHSGVKGDMRIGSAYAVEADDQILSDELREALDELDLDSLFDALD